MPTDPLLLKALKNARSSNETVIDDIQARKDYSKTPNLQAAVGRLNIFNQNLSNAEAEGTLSDSTKKDLKVETGEVNSDILAGLINKNLAMINMGQLNTNRTIEPSVAKANNANMVVEQGFLTTLISLLQVTPTSPVKDTVLTELKVTGAEKTETGLYYQFYNKNQTVRVLAVTDPNTTDAWKKIVWSGGREPSSQAKNQRSISLGELTAVGKPHTVTATVNGKSLSVRVAVVPDLVSFDVSGAVGQGNAKWFLVDGTNETAIVRAIVIPDTSAAYKFLKWQGGEIDAKNPDDRRLVTRKLVSGSREPLPVNAEINLA